MSDTISIKSILKEYTVFFRSNITEDIVKLSTEGAYFVIDANVSKLYAGIFSKLPADRTIVIEANEKNKTLDKCKEIIECLVEKKIRKNNILVAIGGGITQDVTAFTASILYRGIDWQFIPTTLLAQGDSCIGSKTSINLGDKKNLVGNFYPPSAIYIDSKFLNTLGDADIKSGIGEMIHFYMYSGSNFFERIIKNHAALLAERHLFRDYTRESLSIKKSVIQIDEYDRGERNKFNYGHTFGHALETVTQYEINHGQSVTVGMDLANTIAFNYGLMTPEVYEHLRGLLKVNIPPYPYSQIDLEAYVDALSKDKKNVGNDLVCILAERPGKLFKHRMLMDERFKAVVRTYFKDVGRI